MRVRQSLSESRAILLALAHFPRSHLSPAFLVLSRNTRAVYKFFFSSLGRFFCFFIFGSLICFFFCFSFSFSSHVLASSAMFARVSLALVTVVELAAPRSPRRSRAACSTAFRTSGHRARCMDGRYPPGETISRLFAFALYISPAVAPPRRGDPGLLSRIPSSSSASRPRPGPAGPPTVCLPRRSSRLSPPQSGSIDTERRERDLGFLLAPSRLPRPAKRSPAESVR